VSGRQGEKGSYEVMKLGRLEKEIRRKRKL
jgi:hypothetical protein